MTGRSLAAVEGASPSSERMGLYEWWLLADAAVSAGQINRTTKLVALEVSRFADTKTGRNVFPAQATIAARAGLSTRQVGISLARLEEVGLLEVVREATPRSPKSYCLTRPGSGVSVRRRAAGDSGPGQSPYGPEVKPVRVRGEGASYDLTTAPVPGPSMNTSSVEEACPGQEPRGADAWEVAERLFAQELADREALAAAPPPLPR